MLFVPWQKEVREMSRIHGACGEFGIFARRQFERCLLTGNRHGDYGW